MSGSSYVCGVDALVQELLQGEHLAATAALVGAAGAGGPSHLQGALVGRAGGGGLLHGAAAAAGPHVLLQAEAELATALAVRPAEAAVQRACRDAGWDEEGGGGSHMVGPSSIFISQSCIRTKVAAAFVLFTNEYAVDVNM